MSRRPRDAEPRECRRWDSKTQRWGWKHRYDSRSEALAEGVGQDVYPCSSCGFWHRASALPTPRELTLTVSYRPGRLPRITRHR